MKKYLNFIYTKHINIILLSILTLTHLYGQDNVHLVYCNENLSVRNFHPLSEDYKIIVSQDLRSIYLLDASNLLKDTLHFTGRDQFQGLIPLSTSQFQINALNTLYQIEIVRDKFETNFWKKIDFNSLEIPLFNYYQLDNLGIGISKIKNRKGYLDYIYQICIDNICEPLFQEQREYTSFKGSKQLTNNFYFDKKRNLIVIPLEKSNKVIFHNIKDLTTKTYSFPEVDNKDESWYLYFDYGSNTYYSVNFKKTGANTLYSFDIDNFKLKELKNLNHEVEFIIKHSIYFTQTENKKQTCYYHSPLDEELKIKYLNEIKVND